MVLTNKRDTWNLNTFIASCLTVSLLSLFFVTWRETSLTKLYFEFLVSAVIFALTAIEIKHKRDQLIHGVILILTTLPWLFYLLIVTVGVIA